MTVMIDETHKILEKRPNIDPHFVISKLVNIKLIKL